MKIVERRRIKKNGEKSADFFEKFFTRLPKEKYFFLGHPLPRKKNNNTVDSKKSSEV
jgi:hypothetical protein